MAPARVLGQKKARRQLGRAPAAAAAAAAAAGGPWARPARARAPRKQMTARILKERTHSELRTTTTTRLSFLPGAKGGAGAERYAGYSACTTLKDFRGAVKNKRASWSDLKYDLDKGYVNNGPWHAEALRSARRISRLFFAPTAPPAGTGACFEDTGRPAAPPARTCRVPSVSVWPK